MPTEAEKASLGAFSVLLEADSDIDRRGHTRTVPMDVLSLGICRTATLSMREAFSILGYPSPYHFASILANVRDADIWAPIMREKLSSGRSPPRADLDQVLGHCGAVTDTPCAVMWRDLVAAYPEAKVILVERDEDSWYRSITVMLEGSLNPLVRYVLRLTDPGWFGRIFNLGFLWIELWFGSSDLETAKRNARAAYRAHNTAIREAVPKQRLLVYQLGSGWEPLCEFLEKPIPTVPFPHSNESAMLKAAFEAAFGRAIKRSLVNISCVVGFAALMVGVGLRLMR